MYLNVDVRQFRAKSVKCLSSFLENGLSVLRLVFTSDVVGVGVVSGVVRALMT